MSAASASSSLLFLNLARAVSLLGLARGKWWKDAEILILRHQLADNERPPAHSRLTWPGRAWLALLAGTGSCRRELDRTPVDSAASRHPQRPMSSSGWRTPRRTRLISAGLRPNEVQGCGTAFVGGVGDPVERLGGVLPGGQHT